MSRSRRHGFQVVVTTAVIALSLIPVEAARSAGASHRASPATAPPHATVASDSGEVDGFMALGQCFNNPCASPSKSQSNFTHFETQIKPSVSKNDSFAKGEASIDATVTEFTGAFTQAVVTGSISGSAHNAGGKGVPVANTTVSFSIDFGVPGPTQVSVSVGFSTNNTDDDDCTVGDATWTADEGQGFHAVQGAGGDCPTPSGPSSFSGVINSSGTLDVSLDGSVSTEKAGKTDRYSGSVTVNISAQVLPPQGCGARPAATSVAPAQEQCIPSGQITFDGFNSNNNQADVFVASPDGFNPSEPLNLTGTPNSSEIQPAWSPNGKQIAFVRGGQIFVMTAGGSDVQQLTKSPGINEDPAWSPDGNRIAFDSTRDGNQEIYEMESDGTIPVRLTHNPAADANPTWSPDGNTIAFESFRTGNLDIFTMPESPGAAATRLTNDPSADTDPDFTPDGRIVFETERDGNQEIYIMGADGSNPTDLTNDPSEDEEPTVSPDGEFVAFLSNRDGDLAVYQQAISQGTANLVTNVTGLDGDPDWGTSACTIYGTNGPDTIAGDGHICGGPGADRIQGGSAADFLDGGSGDDRINGDDGSDHILGGTGDDVIAGNGGDDFVDGGPGNDDISGDLATTHPGNDVLLGGEGSDTIDGGPLGDELQGGPGGDILDGGKDPDSPNNVHPNFGVFGGPGDDIITACDGNDDKLVGGDGHDTATFDKGVDTVATIEVQHFC